MARATRNTNIDTRSQRLKLPHGKRYWQTIGKGLAIGYRKGKNGGTWYARFSLPDNKYRIEGIGIADDHRDADGTEVLDYFQAQDKIRERSGKEIIQKSRYTVDKAMGDYLEWFKAHKKSYKDTKNTVDAHILPTFKDIAVSDLTTRRIRKWQQALVTDKNIQEDDTEGLRRAKATANRILTVLKAGLNHAYQEGSAPSDEAWRRVNPYKSVDVPKVHYLSEAECKRLINASEPAFRQLVRAALLTGCRYGELTKLRCHDYNPDSCTVLVAESKAGSFRHIPLTDEGRAFFDQVTIGKLGGDLIFTHADGEPWGKSHQSRPMKAACMAAKIDPPATFHHLRHTYGSLLAMRGVPLQVIAKALGHSDTRMTERHYAHLAPNYVADAIRAHLPSFGLESSEVVSIEQGEQ